MGSAGWRLRFGRRLQPRVRVGVDELGRHPKGIGPLAPRVHDHDPRPGGRGLGHVVAERLGKPGCTELDDHLGQRRSGPHDRVGRRDRSLDATLRQGIGEHGPAQPRGELEHSMWIGGAVGRAAGDEHAATLESAGRRRRGRPLLGGARLRVARGAGSASGPSVNGSRNARLRCTGPGPLRPKHGLDERAHGQRAPRRLLPPNGHPGVGSPPHLGCEERVLLDRLRGARVVELRRPVRRADDEGDAGVVGLDDRWMQLGGGRPARDADDDRSPRGLGEADGVERGAALVEADVGPQPLRQRQGERRGA